MTWKNEDFVFYFQTNIVASCASDRSVILYDMRGSSPLRKVSYRE